MNTNPYQIDANWERWRPIPTLSLEETRFLLSPVFGPGISVLSITPIIENSFSNFNYGIQLDDIPNPVLLRLYSHDNSGSLEHHLFQLLKNDFRVPHSYYFGRYGHLSYTILSWVDGLPMTHTLPLLSHEQLTTLGREVGQFLAKLHQQQDQILINLINQHTNPINYVEELINYLEIKPAGKHLPSEIVQQLYHLATREIAILSAFNKDKQVLHGDFKIQNIFCQPETPQYIAAVLDWESAHIGSRYSDLGQLFRVSLPQAFTDSFLFHYQSACTLPSDWMRRAKLCDIISLMSYINTPTPIPNNFKTVQQLLIEYLDYLK